MTNTKLLILLYFIIHFNITSQTGWTVYNTGYSGSIQNIFFIDSLYGWAVTNDTLFKTIDGGIIWQRVYIEPYSDFLNIQFIDRNTGWGSGPVGLFKSTINSGLNWTDKSLQTNAWLDGLDFINYSTGWLTGDFGTIFKTVNSGNNWTQQISNYNNSLISISMVDLNTGYIGMYNGNVLKTTNSGENWIVKYTGFNVRIYDIQFFNINTGYIVGDYPGPGKIAKTSNGGEYWIIKLYADVPLNKFHFINEQTGWIAGTLGRIYYTSNSGDNWIIQNIGGNNYVYDIFFLNELKGFACLSQGRILKTTTGGLVTIDDKKELINNEYVLHQNYPNPFNPTTDIKFTIPKKSYIIINLYDVTGKLLKTLYHGSNDKGEHKITIDMNNFSSGAYFYTLETENIKISKKLTYIN